MANFVLVHGSMHGAWCWRDLVRELEGRGHVVLAPDLPCEDVEAGLGEYADVVEAQLSAIARSEGFVLVGHSLGSRTLPVVAARVPGARMVFLCSAPTALGPVDPEAFSGMVTEAYAAAEFEERPDGARRISKAMARPLFFDDCDEETASWATRQLRWQGSKPLMEASPLADWPDSPMHMIVTRDDRVVRADWLLGEASKWLSESVPVVLPGGHSPMLSRPAVLADALIGCALG